MCFQRGTDMVVESLEERATGLRDVAVAANRKKLRITLISPRGPLYRHRGGIWKRAMRYAPLTLTTLASLVPPEISSDVQIIDEGIGDIDTAAINADLVGISVITGTAPRAYQISADLRRRGIPVV